jgi:hypothetical protein
MTPLEAAVIIADTLLRVRNQWRGNATSPDDINRAVSAAHRAIGSIADSISADVRAELRRRADNP